MIWYVASLDAVAALHISHHPPWWSQFSILAPLPPSLPPSLRPSWEHRVPRQLILCQSSSQLRLRISFTSSLFRTAKKCGLKVFVWSLSLIPWPEALISLVPLRSKESEMFSIINEDHQLPSMSRSSSDRSDSSTGGHPVSTLKTEQKMYGSNLYWEEEHLETSLHGGSDPGMLDPPPWELDGKNTSNTLDLDLSLDLAKKLLLANQTMGPEGSQMFESSYQPRGSGGTTSSSTSASNPRYEMQFSSFSSLIVILSFWRFKTEICRNFKEKGNCLYGELCQFAHGKHELRVSPPSLFLWSN